MRYTVDLRYEGRAGRDTLETRLVYNYAKASYTDVLLFPPGAFAGLFPDGVFSEHGQTGQGLFGKVLYRVSAGAHTFDLGIGGSRAEVHNDFALASLDALVAAFKHGALAPALARARPDLACT